MNIPDYTLNAIGAYVESGVPPSGFLYAVLTNNLSGAFRAADEDNTAAMRDIVGYCWGNIPAICWGSPEKVAEWLKIKNNEEPEPVT